MTPKNLKPVKNSSSLSRKAEPNLGARAKETKKPPLKTGNAQQKGSQPSSSAGSFVKNRKNTRSAVGYFEQTSLQSGSQLQMHSSTFEDSQPQISASKAVRAQYDIVIDDEEESGQQLFIKKQETSDNLVVGEEMM